jgi:type VI secretion system protein ImpK
LHTLSAPTTHSHESEARLKNSTELRDIPFSGGLAFLYEGLLTGVVRLASSRQQLSDAKSFRKRTKANLLGIEDLAVAGGYERGDVSDTHFAVIALLDSIILRSNEPARAEWEMKSLQEELFGKTDAGIVFFEKLDRLLARRDSEQLANILEVYALCLLLGFEGRYSGGLHGELDNVLAKVIKRIDGVRGRSALISPAAALPTDESIQRPYRTKPGDWLFPAAMAAGILTTFCFLVMKMHLVWMAEQLRTALSGIR